MDGGQSLMIEPVVPSFAVDYFYVHVHEELQNAFLFRAFFVLRFHLPSEQIFSRAHYSSTTMSGKRPTGGDVSSSRSTSSSGKSKRQCNVRSTGGTDTEAQQQEHRSRHSYVTEDTTPSSALEALPRDCRLRTCCFLEQFDLYRNYAAVSRQCADDSRAESLWQGTYGKITVRRDTPLADIMRYLCSDAIQRAFSKPRTRLTIHIVSTPEQEASWKTGDVDAAMMKAACLADVTKLFLDVIGNDRSNVKYIHNFISCLAGLFPNLNKLFLPSAGSMGWYCMHSFGSKCKSIEKLCHVDCPDVYSIHGKELCKFQNLTDLNLKFSRIFTWSSDPLEDYGNSEGDPPGAYLLHMCPSKLVRVDLRQATTYGHVNGPIRQSWLMKFVRRTPSLRWFGSDLTVDNVEILQKERPEVQYDCVG